MSNYLNQIESDLYKLNSITNGSGEVVEMVTELKEKYRKAKAFDLIDGYLTEAYNNYHDVEDEGLRSRLISGFISSKVTLLFQQMIEKYGDKEGDGENAKK